MAARLGQGQVRQGQQGGSGPQGPGQGPQQTRPQTVECCELYVGFMLFLKTSMTPCLENEPEAAVDRTIVPNLYKVATKWHFDEEKAPDTLHGHHSENNPVLLHHLDPPRSDHGYVSKASGSGEASHLGHHGREHLPLPQVEPAYQETRGEGAPHPGAGSAMAGKIKKSLAFPKVRSSHLPSSNIAARRLRTAQPQQTGSRATGEGHRGVHPPLGLEPQVLRGLAFGNKANFCYANATLMSPLWMHSEAGIQLDPASPDLRLALQKVIQSAKRIGQLWSCVLWRRAIHPWPNRRSRIPADPLPRDVQ